MGDQDKEENDFQSFAAKAASQGKRDANSFVQQKSTASTESEKSKGKKVDLYKEAAKIAMKYVEGDEAAN